MTIGRALDLSERWCLLVSPSPPPHGTRSQQHRISDQKVLGGTTNQRKQKHKEVPKVYGTSCASRSAALALATSLPACPPPASPSAAGTWPLSTLSSGLSSGPSCDPEVLCCARYRPLLIKDQKLLRNGVHKPAGAKKMRARRNRHMGEQHGIGWDQLLPIHYFGRRRACGFFPGPSLPFAAPTSCLRTSV